MCFPPCVLPLPLASCFFLFGWSVGLIHGLPSDSPIRPEVSRGDPRRWAATAFRIVGFRPFADITEESIASPAARDYAKDSNAKDSNAGDGTGPHLNEMTL